MIECNCSGGKTAIEVRGIKTNIKIKRKDNIPIASIKITGTAGVQESTCILDLEKEQTIKDLEEKANEEVKRIIEKGIEVAKKFETDVFGFGNLLYKYYPHYFNSVEDTWNEIGFKNLKVNTEVSLKLESKGSIESRIKEQ